MVQEKNITIGQVAEYCGVSKSTVSHFMNGKLDSMSEATRDRIACAVEALGYRPNRSAQRLKAGRTRLIGCVIGDIGSPFSALLLKGITEVCEQAGYQVLFADSRESCERERRIIRDFLDNRVDGLIVNTCGGNDELLAALTLPAVLADRELERDGLMDTVTTPNLESARDCVRFLLSCGYEHVAFFSEPIGSIRPRLLRLEGYRQGMAEADLSGEIFELSDSDEAADKKCIRDFLSVHEGKRCAILSANGTTSLRLLLALDSMGLHTGYELGFCTFDNWSWFKLSKPAVTSVALDSVETGKRSAQLLLERIEDENGEKKPRRIVVPSELIVRESTVR